MDTTVLYCTDTVLNNKNNKISGGIIDIYNANKELIDKYSECFNQEQIKWILEDCIKDGCTTQYYIKAKFEQILREQPHPEEITNRLD